jgi:hypothetical protein
MGDSPRLRCAGGASAYLGIMFTPLHMVVLLLLLLSTPLLVRRAFAQSVGSQAEQGGEDCIVVTDEALYRGLGYDHVVYVRNVCEHAQVCEVSSDVSPDAQRVQVAPAAVAMVVTFRGSPASTFQPSVTCERVP